MPEVIQELRREKIAEQKKARTRKLLVLVFVFLILIVGIVLYRYMTAHQYNGYEVLSEYRFPGGTLTVQNTGSHLLVCGNDGTKAIDGNGNVWWEASYQLAAPSVVSCGETTAIADIGGTSVYVVLENGIPYHYETIYPIVTHAVAKQGVTAVLLDNGAEDYIQMYDKDGKLRVDINTKTKTDGFPVKVALSEDGTKLITLYLTFEGDTLVSKVTFYNAGEVGKNYIGNVVGQKSFSGILVADVTFLDNTTVCILTEQGFQLMRMRQVPEVLMTENIGGQIIDMKYAKGVLAVVYEEAETKQRILTMYDVNGKKVMTVKGIPEYDHLCVNTEEVILLSPQKLMIYRRNRSLKFETEFNQNIAEVYSGGGTHYFLVDTGRVRTVKLTNTKNEGE